MTTAAANGVRVCGHYTLLGKLGEGGEAEVWRARDHDGGKDVALKILRAQVAQRAGAWDALQREHEISVQLDHPLILKIDPPVRDGDVIALPMELAPGGDLRRLCGVSYLEIVPVLIEIAQALGRAHERGIVHRDLKPGNVLFDARGHVRLTDFVTASGTASPFTASPQQLRGEPPSPADDVYGLGALAYELLSGHPPYYPRFDLHRVLEEPVPPLKPAHLAPGRLVTFVMAMLAKRPSARPASMAQVIETLDAALNDTLTFAYDEPPDALGVAPAALAAPADGQRTAHVPETLRAADKRLPPGSAAPPAATPSATRSTVAPVRQPLVTRASEPAGSHATQPAAPLPPKTGAPPDSQPAVPPLSAAPPQPAAVGPTIAPGTARGGVRASDLEHGAAVVSSPAPAPRQPPPSSQAAGPAVGPEPVATLRADRAAPDTELRSLWADVKIERVPNLMRLEVVRRPRWPWVLAAAIAALGVAAYLLQLHSAADTGAWAPTSLARLQWLAPPKVVKAVRGVVDAPMRAIAQRAGGMPPTPGSGSPVPQQAPAPTDRAQAAESSGATPTTNPNETASRTHAAEAAGGRSTAGRIAAVAPGQAAAGAVASGNGAGRAPSSRAGAGAAPTSGAIMPGRGATGALAGAPGPTADVGAQPANGVAAYGNSAARSAPAYAGAARGRAVDHPIAAIRPLLADAREAERARDYSRAAQDYSQALALDSSDATARAGLQRANAAFGEGEYAQAVGTGFAALGAGRLDEAHDAFERAHALNRRGREAEEGLMRVNAAMRFREIAESRSRARADLENRLQALVDDPQRLGSPAVRSEAVSLMRQANAEQPSSAVLRSLATRLAILLPQYDKPVHLALVSDNLTQVEIPQIGSFGTFARREIDLKPGRYTVIGTRAGYREVRQDVTVAPGQTIQTISVRCEQPI